MNYIPPNKQNKFVNFSISIYFLAPNIVIQSYYVSLHTKNFYGWYAINMEKRFGEDKKKLMWTKIKLVNLEKKNDILLNLFDDELV